jgi:twinkle protein
MKSEVLSPFALDEEIAALYRDGLPSGDKTGWPSVDRHLSIAPGQLTVLTGWPGSGKSEWLDALLVNLTHQGWRFAMFSPENQPTELHIAKVMEKFAGQPFGAGPTQRMDWDTVYDLMGVIRERFGFMRSVEGSLSAKEIIETAEPWLEQHKAHKRGLVIDPWNELEHWRPQGLSETEYVSQTLSYVRNWARPNKVHVFIVAHPQKMRREADGKLPIPRPDMIAGSQHWWNKADNAVTVWRDMENPDSQNVDIHVQKVRFKHIGRPGVVTLRYDRVCGKYYEIPVLRDVQQYRERSGE